MQAGQQNEGLWLLGRCWTYFGLSLARAGWLLPGESAMSNMVGTPMAADEALGAGRVAIVRINRQEAMTPAMAPAAHLVRWLYK